MRGLVPYFAHGCIRRSLWLRICNVVRNPAYLWISDQWGCGWVILLRFSWFLAQRASGTVNKVDPLRCSNYAGVWWCREYRGASRSRGLGSPNILCSYSPGQTRQQCDQFGGLHTGNPVCCRLFGGFLQDSASIRLELRQRRKVHTHMACSCWCWIARLCRCWCR